MISLRFTAGPRSGQTVRLQTALATLGRAPTCDLIVEDPMVSGVHCTFEKAPAGYIVTDQHSSNGTLINGARIFRALMRVGDELVIGSTGLKVEESSGFAATLFGASAADISSALAAGQPRTQIPSAAAKISSDTTFGSSAASSAAAHAATGRVSVPKIEQQPAPSTSVRPAAASGARPAIAPTAAAGEGTTSSSVQSTASGWVLEIVGPQGQGVRTTPISKDGLVIGRHPDLCSIVLDDPQVSSRHCLVALGTQGPTVQDLGSSNGSYLNDERLQKDVPRLVSASDSIRLGSHRMRIRAARSGAVQAGGVVPKPAPPEPPPKFFVEESGTGRRLEIRLGTPLTIGRLPTSGLVLSDPQSSGQHCELRLMLGTHLAGADSNDGLWVEDLGSRNGTFKQSGVSEMRIEPKRPVRLINGDVLRIGDTLLRISMDTLHDESSGTAADDDFEAPTENLPKSLRGAKLTFITGPRAGTALAVVPLDKVKTTIGRASDCEITVDDKTVSAHHCTLSAEEQGFVLRDHGSSNGTFVNGEQIAGDEIVLGPGDLIRVGLDSMFEFKLEGAAGQTLSGIPSVIAADSEGGSYAPRFVIRGAVLKKEKCSIGRDIACDLFIDDPQVARHAAEIEFSALRFIARSLEAGGLSVNGRAVGETILKTGDVLSVGKWNVRVEISVARLTIYEQVDHASMNRSWAREAASPAQAPVIPEAASVVGRAGGGGGGKNVFQTVFAVDASQLEALAPKREKKKGAPKWKATSDLLADRTRSGAAVFGAVAAACVLGGFAFIFREGAFLDGAISRGHDSARFVELAKAHDLKSGCESCHTPLKPVAQERCLGCHQGFQPKEGSDKAHSHAAAGLKCGSCHQEHRATQSGEALVAKTSCAASGCHGLERPPHQKLKAEAKTGFTASVHVKAPGKMKMPTGDPAQAQEKLHQIHVGVPRKCMSCHTASDGVSAGAATTACFRCHSAPEVETALKSNDGTQCLGCHSMHDKTLARVADLGPRWSGEQSGKRKGGAAAAGLALLFLFVGGFATRYFGRRVDRVARFALGEDIDEPVQARKEPPASKGEVVEDAAKPAVKLKVNVNKEKCVGCACCVNACPTAVLEIVQHKSTVVQESACTSCRECETVCPSGALTMAPEGAPPRLIDLPDLDNFYQTNVAGLYLIGEAAGKSLVKNAANLGKVVVEHMTHIGTVAPGKAKRLGADVELCCIGSGPGGLSAALTARRLGLSFAVLEKDRVYASTIQYCPKGKIFLAEPFDVKNVSLLPILDEATKEDLVRAWDEVLHREQISIRLGEEVLDVRKEGEVFVITTATAVIKALGVVMAPGTRGSPRKLGVPGQELEKVRYMLIDPDDHKREHVMVVGGGDSAVECAMALADQPGNQVTISYRQNEFNRIKPRNKERLDGYIRDSKLKVIYSSTPKEVKMGAVVLGVKTAAGEETTLEVQNQWVYCLLGADLPMTWLQQLGVRYVQKPEGWNPGPTDQIRIAPEAA